MPVWNGFKYDSWYSVTSSCYHICSDHSQVRRRQKRNVPTENNPDVFLSCQLIAGSVHKCVGYTVFFRVSSIGMIGFWSHSVVIRHLFVHPWHSVSSSSSTTITTSNTANKMIYPNHFQYIHPFSDGRQK